MSRIRTVKPEFWTSEQVITCSPPARLLFIGLWNFCDDNGIHPASYIRLKAEVFPVDNFPIEDIKIWINELIANDLLNEYAVNNKSYWIVTGWKNHQKIEKPTYRHPSPPPNSKLINNSSNDNRMIHSDSAISQQLIGDNSPTSRRNVDDSSTTESNGMERKGKEKAICEAEASPVGHDKYIISADVEEIFRHWQIVMNHPNARLDSKREGKIKQALKLGYSIDDLKQAINGCVQTPFNMGDNDRKQRYDDITLILRDASHIEQFMGTAFNSKEQKSNEANHIFAGAI